MPRKSTTAEFIHKAIDKHGRMYSYDNVKYINNSTKVDIVCQTHGKFEQIPNAHLMGQGCPKCGRIKCDVNRKISQESFIERANKKHNNKYNYSKLDYIHNTKKIIVICPEHGDFEQTAHNHLRGYGCLCCAKSSSYSSKAISWLEGISIKEGLKLQHAENGGEFLIPTTRLKADGYCESTNTIYEFYGDNWHGNLNIHDPQKQCHPYSNKTAEQLYSETMSRERIIYSLGFNLITMWENDYNERNKKNRNRNINRASTGSCV